MKMTWQGTGGQLPPAPPQRGREAEEQSWDPLLPPQTPTRMAHPGLISQTSLVHLTSLSTDPPPSISGNAESF
ncbi:hypothetical protein DV515_00015418 [Chloebia gouldiae]|uniref:Uncharacterized protein n=1 Tax=Chloebia gouldiae TaxID=44316 RepID=A0A3L8RVL6_CHLGU|nr:hypothetical protein DV515_00015418 [Chloebia gouldiae]